jgi:hypothetical protein
VVAQRAVRQTRYQRCSTERADGLNALASVRPDLAREWDRAANAPVRPDRIKATYDKAAAGPARMTRSTRLCRALLAPHWESTPSASTPVSSAANRAGPSQVIASLTYKQSGRL